METAETPPTPNNKLNFRLDYRIVVVVLLLVIAGMLVLWKPWRPSPSAKDRTIAVTGAATLRAEADEFIFSPSTSSPTATKTPHSKPSQAKVAKL